MAKGTSFKCFYGRALLVMFSFLEGLSMMYHPKNYQKVLIDSYTNFTFTISSSVFENFFLPPGFVILQSYKIVMIFGSLLVLSSLCTVWNVRKFKVLLALQMLVMVLLIHNPWLQRREQEIGFQSLMSLLSLGIIGGIFIS